MSKPVRLGVIGAGSIGNVHLRAFKSRKQAEVTAVCDVHAGRARKAAAGFDVPHVFTDHRKLLAADIVDAISVCTPNNTHMPITLDGFRAGKHVLCEKPLAMNGAQARRMVAAGKRSRRLLMTAQSARYRGEAQFLKRMVESGRFGDIYYAKAMWLRRSGIPKGWFRVKEQSGGGPLIDLGVHMFDLMWWMMGFPEPVSAFGATFSALGPQGQGLGDWGVNYRPGKFDVEDLAVALIRFKDGRAATIETSWAAHTEDTYFTRFFGTKGGAQLQPELVMYEAEGSAKLNTKPQIPKSDGYTAEAEHFLTCIQRREQPMSPGSQAVVVMDVLDAIRKSAGTGRLVPVRKR